MRVCGTSAFHASADPGRPTNVHIRVGGWPNQQFALLFVDWLNADPVVREGYSKVKREADVGGGGDLIRYVTAKEPWFRDAYRRAWEWADSTGWKP
jgi:dephospho-CoA kinase